MISRDILSRPEASKELLELAKKLGQKIVHISIAQLPTVEDPALDGQSFLALVDFLPRAGELIRTENKKLCEVKRVLHVIRPFSPGGKTEAFGLFPTVFAVHKEEEAAS
jgi:hypothetical protein